MLISTSSAYRGRNGGVTTRAASAMAIAVPADRADPRDALTSTSAATASSQEPLRAEQQHQHEHREDHELLQRSGQDGRAHRLGEADDDAADERAHEVAHTAEHHDHEGHDVERLTDVGRHVEERRD